MVVVQREIASYLSPTGILAFVWNLESSSAKLQTDLRALYEPYDLGSPQYYKMLWRKGFEVEAYKELFEPPAESHTEWAWGMTEDSVSRSAAVSVRCRCGVECRVAGVECRVLGVGAVFTSAPVDVGIGVEPDSTGCTACTRAVHAQSEYSLWDSPLIIILSSRLMPFRPMPSRPAASRHAPFRPVPPRCVPPLPAPIASLRSAQLVDRVFSKSFMTPTHLNGQARTDFEASLRKLIREADKEWVDQPVSGSHSSVNRIEPSRVGSSRLAERDELA